MRDRLFLMLVALYLVACASSPPNRVPPASSRPPTQGRLEAGGPRTIDAEQFRKELEAVYGQILSSSVEEAPAQPAVVDVEAAASIPIPEHRTINSAVRLFS